MSQSQPVKVISLGGSIIVPDNVDTAFLVHFKTLIDVYLQEDTSRRLILVCGGGFTCRKYQRALKAIVGDISDKKIDWLGIAATKINAEFIRLMFGDYCQDPVVSDPTADFPFSGRILVASGWKPGFSTDYDAVLLAEKFKADTLINLSNIAQVYTADPKKDPEARPLEAVNWAEFLQITGDKWIPGSNSPMDPMAAHHAAKIKMKVYFASGRNTENVRAIFNGKSFYGTVIGPN